MRCKGIFDFFADPDRASPTSLLWYYNGVRKTAMTEVPDKPAILIVASQNGFINTPIHGGVQAAPCGGVTFLTVSLPFRSDLASRKPVNRFLYTSFRRDTPMNGGVNETALAADKSPLSPASR